MLTCANSFCSQSESKYTQSTHACTSSARSLLKAPGVAKSCQSCLPTKGRE